MNVSDARKAHKILDDLLKRKPVLDEEREFLRSALPELPKQMTLEEIIIDVRGAWSCTSGNDWGGDICNMDVSIEDWLSEIYAQLIGLKDVPANTPALPVDMRLADHKHYGRVVVSPRVGPNGRYEIFNLDPGMSSGTDLNEVEPDSLTFVDAESAKPVHPEFLDSPEDYKLAPNGTIVVYEKSLPWVKRGGTWLSAIADAKNSSDEMGATPRRALRWGWGE